MVAGDLMDPDVLALSSGDTPIRAAELLTSSERGTIPVVDDQRRLVSMVTETDEITVADVMRTDDLVSVTEDELAAEAALMIMRHSLPQLPVVRDGKLVGRTCRKALIMELVNPSLGVTCQP